MAHGRIEYVDDPDAPTPTKLIPAASAVVVDETGRILLHLRSDNERWSIPGGGIEVGESVGDAVVREVREETGFEVEPQEVVGVYSDPRNVVAFPDGEVRQRFSICLACRLLGGSVDPDQESLAVRWVHPAGLEELDMSPAVRLRIDDCLAGRRGVLR